MASAARFLKFPETCYCISLRTGTTIIGLLGVDFWYSDERHQRNWRHRGLDNLGYHYGQVIGLWFVSCHHRVLCPSDSLCEPIPDEMAAISFFQQMNLIPKLKFFSVFFFIMTLAFSLSYRIWHNDLDPNLTFYGIVEIISMEYTTAMEIVFNALLLFGTFTEKSCFVLAWLICQLNIFSTTVLTLLFWLIRWDHIYMQDIIPLVILAVVTFIVFSYYRTMTKPIVT